MRRTPIMSFVLTFSQTGTTINVIVMTCLCVYYWKCPSRILNEDSRNFMIIPSHGSFRKDKTTILHY